MQKFIASTLITLSLSTFCTAQTGLMGYGSNALLPAQMANPAMVGNNRFHVGLPALSSVQMQMNNSFKLSYWLTQTGETAKIDISKFNSFKKDINTLGFNVSDDLFNFGFRVKDDHYFSAGLQAHSMARANFSGDLITLIGEGNQNSPVLNLDHERIYALSFANAYVGYARTMLEGKFRYGIHAKYIAGYGHFQTDEVFFGVKTDQNSKPLYALELEGTMSGRAAGLFLPDNPNKFDWKNHGRGFGIDLGASLQIRNAFEVSAAITNLGVINWQADQAGLIRTKGTGKVTFNGITRQIGTNTANKRNELDSTQQQIENIFTPKITNDSYVSGLPTTIYGSFAYQPNDKHNVLLLLRGQFLNQKLSSMMGVKYQFTPKRWLQLMSGISWIQNGGVGFGGGVVLSPGPVQIHILADNLQAVQIDNVTYAQIQVGLNILLKKKKEEVKEEVPIFK
jgi:hypothetical protein